MLILSGDSAKKNNFNPIKTSGGVQRPRWKILNTNFLFQIKNLGKETDVSAHSERAKFKNSLSTLQQIKGESIKFMRVLFFYFSTPKPLNTIQVRSAGIFFCKFTAPRCKK
jgi:hypothetical protein